MIHKYVSELLLWPILDTESCCTAKEHKCELVLKVPEGFGTNTDSHLFIGKAVKRGVERTLKVKARREGYLQERARVFGLGSVLQYVYIYIFLHDYRIF